MRMGEDGRVGWEPCMGDGSHAHDERPALATVTEPWCHSCLQGTCQWVTLDFPRTVKVSQVHIQFQGGFSSRLCTLEGKELVWGARGSLCLSLPTPGSHSCLL